MQQSAHLGLLVRESSPHSENAGFLPGRHTEDGSEPQDNPHIGKTCSEQQAGADTSPGPVCNTSSIGVLPSAMTAEEAVDLVSPVPVPASTDRPMHTSELCEPVEGAHLGAWQAASSPSPSDKYQTDAATADGKGSDEMQQEVLSPCKRRLAAAYLKEVSVEADGQKLPMQPKVRHSAWCTVQGSPFVKTMLTFHLNLCCDMQSELKTCYVKR